MLFDQEREYNSFGNDAANLAVATNDRIHISKCNQLNGPLPPSAQSHSLSIYILVALLSIHVYLYLSIT